ncbi:hypothetical protein GCM10008967_15570 [Bacillus carboniphilus]|uniref:Uncharacterized protein n=1 Tax=Bacillus carboniphilus TaxID=86663 RepID=A0ABP3FWL0_9BACI
MVNQDFEKFREIQSKHRPPYLGGDQNQQERNKDFSYNKKGKTDSVGVTEQE